MIDLERLFNELSLCNLSKRFVYVPHVIARRLSPIQELRVEPDHHCA